MASSEKKPLPSPGEWETHKDDICKLYPLMKLEDLMKFMESKGLYAT